jgi:hypothetical protein
MVNPTYKGSKVLVREHFLEVIRCSDVSICYFGRQEKPGSSNSTACCSAHLIALGREQFPKNLSADLLSKLYRTLLSDQRTLLQSLIDVENQLRGAS